MTLSPELIALAHYMAGEFDNREQAISDPAWYVHLRLWQRPVPVPLFTEDSLTLFAEQANILNLDRPYRPRLLQLRELPAPPESRPLVSATPLNPPCRGDEIRETFIGGDGTEAAFISGQTQIEVQYHMLKDPGAIRGAGRNPALLRQLTPDQIELLPGCTLTVTQQLLSPGVYRFSAILPPGKQCCFTYEGEIRQVSLGFEASPAEFLSYDKGIEPDTGKAIWGALLGPFCFTKREDFSREVLIANS